MDRRSFIRTAVGISLTVAGGSVLAACKPLSADYGDLLAPNADGLRLPPGFTSRTVATTGQQVGTTGFTWHASPDGGACFDAGGGGWIYVSNSEVSPGGGASMIRFDATGDIVDARAILSGTSRNCAGGATPWGTWLSCEEVSDGRVWECDPFGVAPAVVHPSLGRFNHEAAAVDPVGQCVYLTEDRVDGGFYRFLPSSYPDLSAGELQVLTESAGVVGWAPVPDPDGDPVATRHQVPTMKTFNGGEGLWVRDLVYFVTKGDNRLWVYVPSADLLGVIYDDDTSTTPVLTGVDNITMPPAPGPSHVFVAEDGGNMELVAVEVGGEDNEAHVFCRVEGPVGSEITGPAFSPDGTRLYLSSQRDPGETFEVTGPFLTL